MVFRSRQPAHFYMLSRYTANRQPGKALPYFLRLRRPNVFELIRENNLFTDVQDQVLLLVEFDHELMGRRRKERAQKAGKAEEANGQEKGESEAIQLLVDNIHSIPVCFHTSRERRVADMRHYFRSTGSYRSCRRGLTISFCTSMLSSRKTRIWSLGSPICRLVRSKPVYMLEYAN